MMDQCGPQHVAADVLLRYITVILTKYVHLLVYIVATGS